MSLMPYLTPQETQVDMVNVFGGYNHKASIQDGEFFDMKNLTCDDYPLAASRAKRGLHNLGIEGEVLGVVGQDKLNVVYNRFSDSGRSLDDVKAGNLYELLTYSGEKYYKCNAITVDFNLRQATTPAYLYNKEKTVIGDRLYRLYESTAYIQETDNYFKARAEETEPSDYESIFVRPFVSSSTNYSEHAITDSGVRMRVITYYVGSQYNAESVLTKLKASMGSGKVYSNGLKAYFNVDMGDGKKTYGPYVMTGFSYSTNVYNNCVIEFEIPFDDIITQAFFKSILAAGEKEIYFEAAKLGTDDCKALEEIDQGYTPDTTFKVESDNDITVWQGKTVEAGDIHINVSNVTESGEGLYDVTIPKPHGAVAANTLIGNNALYIANYGIESGILSEETELGLVMSGEHTVVKMGAYVLIFPEKIRVNTSKISDGTFTEIENLEKYEEFHNTIDWRCCYHDGTDLKIDYVGNTSPTNPTTGQTWADTSELTTVLRKYNKDLGTWAVISPYIEFRGSHNSGELSKWKEYDALEVDFGDLVEDGYVDLVPDQKYYVISDTKEEDGFYHIRFPVAFKKTISAIWHETNNVSFKMEMPILDYVFECGNRLWGCRYGTDVKGDFVNEIFASRLGDPGNFHYFANTSMDAFYVSLGDEGPFTGGVAYNSQPVFFRQNKVHRITGQYPANYQLKTSVGYGVQIGSHKSIVNVNNIIYYLSAVGMMAYSGDIPVSIADPFGKEMYHNGIAGTIGNKYYISMLQEDDTPVFFCYDDAKGMWHKEDDLRPLQLVTYNNECYAVTSEGMLIATGGVTGDEEPDFDWMMQTGEIGYGSPFKKQLIKMTIRLKMGIKSYANIDIQYDNDGNWIHCSELRPTGRVGSIAVPISPCRCDYFTIRIKGHGDIKLVSVAKFYEEGSDEA